jgi:hypothetical protein
MTVCGNCKSSSKWWGLSGGPAGSIGFSDHLGDKRRQNAVLGRRHSLGHDVSAFAQSNTGIQKIQHIVIIMQENRSFDSYFGTFPGADGIPMQNGVPTVCVPDPANGGCVQPYHDTNDLDHGGPHGYPNAVADVDGGKMDGFIAQAEKVRDPRTAPDVMGYHTSSELPNYWTYARNYVLQDQMFSSAISWSFTQHLYMVSEWSANCGQTHDPMKCVNDVAMYPNTPVMIPGTGNQNSANNLLFACRDNLALPLCQNEINQYGVTSDEASALQKLLRLNCPNDNNLFVTPTPASVAKYNTDLASCESYIPTAPVPAGFRQDLLSAAGKFTPPDFAWTGFT